MTDLNPLTGAILGSSQVQSGLQKQKLVRRLQNQRKNAAAQDDTFEQQVESGEEVGQVRDENDSPRQRQPRRQAKPQDSAENHLDMTA